MREFPFEGLVLTDGNGHVELSRETLTNHHRVREAAQLEAFEHALALVVERARSAFLAQTGWVDAVRAGLTALLDFFDEEPLLARYLVVHSAQAGPVVHARRGEVLEQVAMLLDDEREPARGFPPPLTAHAVASGVLGVLQAQLSQSRPGALAHLADSLMSFTVMPFLGVRAARRELANGVEAPGLATSTNVHVLQDPGRRLNHHREVDALKLLAVEPGLNNKELALRMGVEDRAQISRLLARLARLGLIENTGSARVSGAAKAWRLTKSGERLAAAIADETHAPGAAAVLDLPAEFAGRLDYWAVCVLRAVGDQPWLTGKEVAARAGVRDQSQVPGLLARLSGLGLIESMREAHGRGAPRAWRITDAGRKLDTSLGREAPAPPRSLARELMWKSGGRLSENAVSVLRVCAAEPGLSNGEIALRVELADANSMSQLLARLTRRGLIENARKDGRQNVWRLTAGGETLERAIRQEAPVPAARSMAFDVLKDQGGRLNHRVVSVLALIGVEPGLGNLEIAQRLGLASKGHTSRLLARLARFGLIENQALDPAPFQANAWRLSRTGRELAESLPLPASRQALKCAPW